MPLRLALIALLLLASAGCGGDSAPAGPVTADDAAAAKQEADAVADAERAERAKSAKRTPAAR